MRTAMALLAFVSVSSAALADEVQLNQGRSLVGIAREENGRVVVETRLGTISVPASEVKSIVPGRTVLHEYRDRVSALGPSPDAAKIYALAVWSRDHGLVRYVSALLHWTIALDPDHRQARSELDFVSYQGRWMLRQEREAALERRRTQVQPKQPTTEARYRPTPRYRAMPEQDPGYVYLGIPPSIPRRGSQVYNGGGYYGISFGYVIVR